MGERRELNPRMVDSQSTALIHLATSALRILSKNDLYISQFLPFHYPFFLFNKEKKKIRNHEKNKKHMYKSKKKIPNPI